MKIGNFIKFIAEKKPEYQNQIDIKDDLFKLNGEDGYRNLDGREEGEWMTGDKDVTNYKKNYKNGILDGEYRKYWFYPRVNTEGQYVRGYKDGVWKWYDVNGGIESIEHWDKGNRNGEFIKYHQNKNPFRYQLYKDNVFIKGEFYYPNGNIKSKIETIESPNPEYLNPNFVRATRKDYHENGNLKLEGEVTIYNSLNDWELPRFTPIGEFIHYDANGQKLKDNEIYFK
jgi:antitoxin component YwqK of YwqJK toxin-antitoxin module